MKNELKNDDNFMLYIPHKKHTTWENRNGKVYLIFYHTKPTEKFVRWLVKKPNKSDIELDALGSEVWQLIDGESSVFQIGKSIHDKFGKKCEPVYDRLILFLRYLNRKGWITFERGNQEEGGIIMLLNKKIEELRGEVIKSTQEVIKIKSVQGDAKPGMPFGEGPNEALNYALKLSESLGFKTTNLDGYIGYAEYGEGEDYVAVLGHLDVVPEGDGWKYPPYGAEIHDGKIYGRGTTDDKGPIIAALYGLKAVKELKLPISKRVRVIFGTNEETGSKEVEYYMEKEKAPVSGFTPDAEYPIIYGEKGITIFDVVKDLKIKGTGDVVIKSMKGGQRANMVPDYCEAVLEVKNTDAVIENVNKFSKESGFDIKAEAKGSSVVVKSVGVGAHGSLPHLGKNAIMQMFKCLSALPIGNDDIAEFINFLNVHAGFETHGESFNVCLEDKESGKLSFNIGTINMNENRVSMAFNLRYPVTYKYEDMMDPFNKTIEGTGIRVENMMHQAPLYFPADHPLIKTLQKVYTQETGKEANLLAIGGGTYAKEMPNIVAFGPIFPGKPDLDHQANEYIEVEDLIQNAKIYAHAIFELAK